MLKVSRNLKMIFALTLAIILIISTGLTVTAASDSKNSTAVSDRNGATVNNSDIFVGYKVTVIDKKTPAADMRGRLNDPAVMCFVSAAGKEIGSISYKDYNAIAVKNKKVVKLKDGGTLGVPPDGRSSWNEWFADEFNKYRGLASGSREEAVASNTAETIKENRKELIRLVNIEREKYGLPAYIENNECMKYSQMRAKELLTLFSHTRPDGTYAGYEIISAKSNSPAETVKAWMESTGHKAAILSEDHTYVGAGCYITSTGGVYWEMFFALDPELHANSFLNSK